jgi:fluoroacetyl-CoA thioesterase
MRTLFKSGDIKIFKKSVTEADQAMFDGTIVHPVCSTFSLARDFEWSSRLFVLEMKDEGEEGVGTSLSIDHKSPAFVGEEITYTATLLVIRDHELTCAIEAKVDDRLIATGTTGQKMIPLEKLSQLFAKKK